MTDDKVKARERLKVAATKRRELVAQDIRPYAIAEMDASVGDVGLTDLETVLAEGDKLSDNYAVLEAETVRLREIEGRLFERGFTTGAGAVAFIDSVLDRAEAAEAKLTALVEAVRRCKAQFEFYVEQHMAKKPPDTAKADANEHFANICRQALAHHSAPVGEAAGDETAHLLSSPKNAARLAEATTPTSAPVEDVGGLCEKVARIIDSRAFRPIEDHLEAAKGQSRRFSLSGVGNGEIASANYNALEPRRASAIATAKAILAALSPALIQPQGEERS